MPTLTSLFSQFPLKIAAGTLSDVPINQITADSRKVEAGDLFIAISGEYFDGHQYIAKAIEQGAVAIVGEQEIANLSVPYIQVENARQALAYLAAAYYSYPARKLTMLGVTGTDGKTTTSNFLYQILREAKLKVGMISTVNAIIGDEILDTGFHVTTPDALDTQRYLAQMVDAGLTHVILETTSHGWAQYRIDACEFDIGVVTNITHEHLDYHGSYEAYRAAKGRLFASLGDTVDKPQGNPRLAVLNKDDISYDYLSRLAPGPQACYSVDTSASARAENIRYLPSGIKFDIVTEKLRVAIKTNLVGGYNISNILAAFSATVFGLGVDPKVAARGIAALEGIPGRMERIDKGQDFSVIVDFAHTPFALKAAIESGREMTKGRVIALFGSAGLRDREKRRMMAEYSAELADLTVLTAEDPRTESLDDILEEMKIGAELRGGVENETFWRVHDRGEAIHFALTLAQPGDMVLVCGKGHEQSMCFGETEYPWDDRMATRAALGKFLGVDAPAMPYLPTQGK
ncbi:MAG: UDP-N-acetylmuramoyl-L-alanyl-D-glutamate--2,6-diaminopimelate ligase [Anaerolineae bacterium]|jgi:UDP-N-acetylmuramoyl-L-alanyl-D-glutamate--2,6-diaminopimelate ligase|nr:UDP-N-acetylmuramoyl-L-alanyl-D-glutamate--2,6-diaminopimelate ligase [Anaerolineae bacterium]MBT7070010.1 UDP-N-acetylmuramoyl-L-alanyl-D-glutamate--2,6-diaminopimelate ligase [Anaerolineae bacterium]